MQTVGALWNQLPDVVKVAVPAFVGYTAEYAMHLGQHDSRIGKIVGGVGLCASGLSALWKSGITSFPGSSHKGRRITVASLGAAMTLGGLYAAATGVAELFFSSPCAQSLPRAQAQLQACPASRNFIKGVDLQFACEQADRSQQGSFTMLPAEKQVTSSQLLSGYNAVKTASFTQEMAFCNVTEEAYVESMYEKIYRSMRDAAFEIPKRCQKQGLWPRQPANQYHAAFTGKDPVRPWTSAKSFQQFATLHRHDFVLRDKWKQACGKPRETPLHIYETLKATVREAKAKAIGVLLATPVSERQNATL